MTFSTTSAVEFGNWIYDDSNFKLDRKYQIYEKFILNNSMQVFLPYADFKKTAQVLDNKRLGNQCYRECKTLLNDGWVHHPVSKQWKNYKYALCSYALALVDEMEKRNAWQLKTIIKWRQYYTELRNNYIDNGLPPWLGDPNFHSSHRSNLLRKDFDHYSQFGWTEGPNLSYVWPK